MSIFNYNNGNSRDYECNRIINGALQKQSTIYNKTLTKVEMWKISSNQLENLIQKHLGIKFDFVANEEAGNHYTPFFNMKAVEHFPDEDRYTYHYFEHLIYLGVLEPGSYLVDHTW